MKKENEAIKSRIIGDIRIPFQKEEDYYRPVRVGNFCNDSYKGYESNGDKNKALSIIQ